jgi:hypothetical protein
MDSCDQYLRLFPGSDKTEDIRRTRAEAKMKSVGSAPAPAAAPATPP